MYLLTYQEIHPFIFVSFLIVLLTPFFSKPDSSRELAMLIVSSISLFEIINVVSPNPTLNFFFE